MRSLPGLACATIVCWALSAAAGRAVGAAAARPSHVPVRTAPATTVYVSPLGDDRWSGGRPAPNRSRTDGPFATLARARAAVRDVIRRGPTNPIRVLVQGGRYYLPETLVLDERDSGRQGAPVVWSAYPGQSPVLSGGVRIVNWRPYRGSIVQSDLRRVGLAGFLPHDLFVDGVRQLRARTPYGNPARDLYAGWAFMRGGAGADGFEYGDGLLKQPLTKPTQALVTFMVGPAGGWGSDTVAVTSIDTGRRIIHTRYDHAADPLLGFNANTRFYIENAIESLERPGEWCADTETSMLYFEPPTDARPGAPVVVPVLPTLLTLSNARWVTVSGFTFTETAVGGLGSVRCEDCEHIGILRNCFLAAGGRGLALLGRRRTCSDLLIKGNTIAWAGDSGLFVGGSVRDCRILDNDVHRCGVFNKYAAGIEFPFYGGAPDVGPRSYTDRVVIAHNRVHDLPRDGIQLGANPYGRNLVEYNRVERTALETVDAGAIRCHRVLSGVQGVANLPPMVGHVIRHNLVADTRGCGVQAGRIVCPYPWPTFGIYLDESSSHCIVRHNTVLRSGVGLIMNPGAANRIDHNRLILNEIGLCFQAPAPFAELNPPLGGNRFLYNIVRGTGAKAVAISLHNWTPKTLAASDFNIFGNSSAPVVFEAQTDSSAPVHRSTLSAWRRAGYDIHSRLSVPMREAQ